MLVGTDSLIYRGCFRCVIHWMIYATCLFLDLFHSKFCALLINVEQLWKNIDLHALHLQVFIIYNGQSDNE